MANSPRKVCQHVSGACHQNPRNKEWSYYPLEISVALEAAWQKGRCEEPVVCARVCSPFVLCIDASPMLLLFC